MKNAMMTLVAIALVCAIAGSASAAFMQETFDTDPTTRGWIADGPNWSATGGNPGGYYSGTRNNWLPWVGMDLFGANLPGTYGVTEYTISIDQKRIAGGSGLGHAWEIYDNVDAARSSWKYDFAGDVATEWTNYSLTINTDWSDAEAEAEGWYRNTGAASFSSVWTNVKWALFAQSTGGTSGIDNTIGVDNFLLVPEPATIGLLVIGGAAGLLRRKK